jgi:hypothetical protein
MVAGKLWSVAWKIHAIKSSSAGWPPEVWVVFASLPDAREYVERARWAFRIETMPVYASYQECPAENRGTNGGMSVIAAQSLGRTESEGDRRTWRDLSDGAHIHTVYAVAAHDSDSWDYTEVELFYASRSAAEEDVAHRYAMAMVVPFDVYRSYQDCPADRRFDGHGRAPGSSQLLERKRR